MHRLGRVGIDPEELRRLMQEAAWKPRATKLRSMARAAWAEGAEPGPDEARPSQLEAPPDLRRAERPASRRGAADQRGYLLSGYLRRHAAERRRRDRARPADRSR